MDWVSRGARLLPFFRLSAILCLFIIIIQITSDNQKNFLTASFIPSGFWGFGVLGFRSEKGGIDVSCVVFQWKWYSFRGEWEEEAAF